MPTTEIYLCRPGQALKEGRMVYGDIADKAEAQSDAEQRVRFDGGIAKVAYYHVRDDGSFKLIYTYTNPKAGQAPKPIIDPPARRPRRPKPKPKPKTTWQKIKSGLGLD